LIANNKHIFEVTKSKLVIQNYLAIVELLLPLNVLVTTTVVILNSVHYTYVVAEVKARYVDLSQYLDG